MRQYLKLFSRQYKLYMKNNVSLQNNLFSLSGKTFPSIDMLFARSEIGWIPEVCGSLHAVLAR